MDVPGSPELAVLLRLVRERGAVVGDGATTIDLPEDLLVAYLDRLGRSYAPFDDDPRAAARGLLAVQLADDLTGDDGCGRVRRVALVLGEDGPDLVLERTDDPPPAPATDGAAHDDPVAFGRELEALARFLRDRGIGATADPAAATVRVGRPDGPETTVDLRPDRYRRHLEASEEEYDAIGGDPREHAWRAWCHRVAAAVTQTDDPPRRLSFVESPDGDVVFVADAVGDEPPEARHGWSAEPGS